MRCKISKRIWLGILSVLFIVLSLLGVACKNEETGIVIGADEQIFISETYVEMYVGEEHTLFVSKEDERVSGEWTSSDPSVATVADGKVTALRSGSSVIAAAVGEKNVSCFVQVKEAPEESAELRFAETRVIVSAGESATVTPKFYAGGEERALPENLRYVCDAAGDSEYVRLNKLADGSVSVEGLAACGREISVTAFCDYNGKTVFASFFVTVHEGTFIALSDSTVNICLSDLGGLYPVEYALKAEVYVDGEQSGQTVGWSVRDETIASVTSDGIVSALSAGETYVEASFTNGGKVYTAKCLVKVSRSVYEVPGTVKLYKQAEDGASVLDLTGLPGADDFSAVGCFDVTDGTEIGAGISVDGSFVTIEDVSKLPSGERKLKVFSDTTEYIFNATVVTKIIRTYKELMTMDTYERGEVYSYPGGNFEYYRYGGYFELGNNIDLTGKTIGKENFYADFKGNVNSDEDTGFNGTFDGCGYTLYGGSYDEGGLFGVIGKKGVVKNVALVNATLCCSSYNVNYPYKHPVLFGYYLSGKMDNVLADMEHVDQPAGTAFRAGMFSRVYGGEITNCVCYYPGGPTASYDMQVAVANYCFTFAYGEISYPAAVAENLYVISDSNSCFTYLKSENFHDVRFAAGTTCAEIFFDGLNGGEDGLWTFDGSRAAFRSTVDFIETRLSEIEFDSYRVLFNDEDIVFPGYEYGIVWTKNGEILDGNELALTGVTENQTLELGCYWNGILQETIASDVYVNGSEQAETLQYEIYSGKTSSGAVENTAALETGLDISSDSFEAATVILRGDGFNRDIKSYTSVNDSKLAVGQLNEIVGKQSGEYELVYLYGDRFVTVKIDIYNKIISSADDLLNLRIYSDVSADETINSRIPYYGRFALDANIDLGDVTIGEDAYLFTGMFDGRGYTISGGVYLSGGLFGGGVSGGTVKNVAFEDVTVQYSNLLYGNSRVDTLFGRLEGATLENVYVNVTGARESGQADTQMSLVVFANVIENSTLKNVIVKSVKTWVDRNLFAGSIYAGSTKFENVYVLGELTSSQYNADTWEQYPDYGTYAGLTQLAHEATWSEIEGADAFPDTYWDKTGAPCFDSSRVSADSYIFRKYEEGTAEPNTSGLVLTVFADGEYTLSLDGEKIGSVTAEDKRVQIDNAILSGLSGGNHTFVLQGRTSLTVHVYIDDTATIATAEELLRLRDYCTAEVIDGVTVYTGTILLGANIDLGENVIGEDGYRFAGTFDGQGYTISGGVYVSGGLFGGGVSGGTVKNVAFEDVTVQYSNLLYGNSRVDTLFGRLEGATLENVYVNVTGARESGQADTQMSLVAFANVIENSTLKNVIVKSVKTWVDRNLFAGSIYAGSTKFENVYVLGELTSSQYNADTWEQYPDYGTYAGLTQLAHEATWSEIEGADAFPDTYWDKTGEIPLFVKKNIGGNV